MNDNWMPDLDPMPSRKRPGSVTMHWHLKPHHEALVYFISAVEAEAPNAPIKIGISRTPVARLAQMQQLCPVRLEIMALCEGGARRERIYHERFAEHRLHGEWFARNEALLRLIRYYEARKGLRAEILGAAK